MPDLNGPLSLRPWLVDAIGETGESGLFHKVLILHLTYESLRLLGAADILRRVGSTLHPKILNHLLTIWGKRDLILLDCLPRSVLYGIIHILSKGLLGYIKVRWLGRSLLNRRPTLEWTLGYGTFIITCWPLIIGVLLSANVNALLAILPHIVFCKDRNFGMVLILNHICLPCMYGSEALEGPRPLLPGHFHMLSLKWQTSL